MNPIATKSEPTLRARARALEPYRYHGDVARIARTLGCSWRHVHTALRGDFTRNTLLIERIITAAEALVAERSGTPTQTPKP